jgi:hypothetical protein
VENLMQLNFMVLDKNDQDCKEKFLASNEIGFSEIIEANKYLAKVISLESLLRFVKKRANELSEI